MSSPTLFIPPKMERSGNLSILTFTVHPIRDVESVIARELEGLATEEAGQHLLLDFVHVDYLNSTELGTLIALHKRVEAAGGRLTLFNMSEQLFKVFTVTHLDTYLEICRPAAVARFERTLEAGEIPELAAR